VADALKRIESNPQKMLESVMMFGKRKRVFLRSTFRRIGGAGTARVSLQRVRKAPGGDPKSVAWRNSRRR
jgi:hypothetical protein